MKKNSITTLLASLVFLVFSCQKTDNSSPSETFLQRGWQWDTDSTITKTEIFTTSTGQLFSSLIGTAIRPVLLADSMTITNDRIYNKRTDVSLIGGGRRDTTSYILTTIDGGQAIVRTNLLGTKDTLEVKTVSATKLILRHTYPTAITISSGNTTTIIVNKYDEWTLH